MLRPASAAALPELVAPPAVRLLSDAPADPPTADDAVGRAPLARLVVVDDDLPVQEQLRTLLHDNGYAVVATADAATGLRLVDAGAIDLVLTELVAGGVTGLDLCRRLRSDAQVGVIVVSREVRDLDKVVALEVGADDYVTKPFSERELLLRVAAVLRRRRRPEPRIVTSTSAAGHVRLDGDGLVADVGGRRVHLSPLEFRLLSALVAAEGRVLSRRQLEAALWDRDRDRDTHAIEVCVRRLRRKVEPDVRNPVLVLAVRGLGYRFGTAGEAPAPPRRATPRRRRPS